MDGHCPMKQLVFFLAVTHTIFSGCNIITKPEPTNSCCPDSFYVQEVAVNPSFTQFTKSVNDKSYYDRLQVFVELRDQFNDPMKATGKFRFELYTYDNKPAKDHRGLRIPGKGLQTIDLSDPKVNQQHWDKISGHYQFVLDIDQLPNKTKHIILQVTFLNESPYRLDDSLELPYP